MVSNALPRLPSQAEFTVLSVLDDHGPSYGLELVARSNGAIKRGGVYVLLGRLQEKGLVASTIPTPTKKHRGLPRPVYNITPLGQKALAACKLLASLFG